MFCLIQNQRTLAEETSSTNRDCDCDCDCDRDRDRDRDRGVTFVPLLRQRHGRQTNSEEIRSRKTQKQKRWIHSTTFRRKLQTIPAIIMNAVFFLVRWLISLSFQ